MSIAVVYSESIVHAIRSERESEVSMKSSINIVVNGSPQELAVEPRESLAFVLRDRLGLTGTKIGCDTGTCGACTVLLGGRPAKSCIVLGVQADGQEIRTIEDVAGDGELHPLQEAFTRHHALQCGYCTAGFVMASLAFLADHPAPSEAEVRWALKGNICRCTGYRGIVNAVREAGTAEGLST
jgi:aerobic carbon-monoxide dehydrogenase small subunit